MASRVIFSNPTYLPATNRAPSTIDKVPLPKIPIKTTSLKEICQRGGVRDAFEYLSNNVLGQNFSQKRLVDAYSLLLELCATQKALSQGQQIHALILKSNFLDEWLFLGTKLVLMYGKCGSFQDAKRLFDELPELNIFALNAMIGACVANEEPLEALRLYEDMRILHLPFDAHTFPSVLKACALTKDLRCGCEIHGLAIKLGFLSNVFVINSLVGMYSKCDDVHSAHLLFSGMDVREDVVSWNSIISAHSASGMSAEALRMFGEMLNTGVNPSTYTFVPVLQALEELGFEKIGMGVHAIALKSGHCLDIYVANSLIVMYTKNNRMDEAARIFWDMNEKDNVSWNSLLSGYVQNGLYYDAYDVFREMKEAIGKPDEISLVSILAAFGRSRSVLQGMEIHAFALKNGMDCNMLLGNSIMDMYAKCGRTDYMRLVFDRMPCKDYISWTTVVSGYAQNHIPIKALHLFRMQWVENMEIDLLMIGSLLSASGDLKDESLVKQIHGLLTRRGLYDLVMENTLIKAYGACGNINYACNVFALIKVKNVVSFTSMMSCYVNSGLADEALNLVPRMNENEIELDCVALLSILSATADLSALRKGKETHGFLLRKGFGIDCPISTSLVEMYACCGNLDDSYKIFNCTLDKDVPIWTSMISALGMHGFGKKAIEFFRMMEGEKLCPDHVTFLSVLYACSHSSLVEEGKRVFESMQNEYKLEPWPEHYTCIVDMLGRANHLEEAFQFVKTMKTEPTAAVWCSLLSACKIHSNERIGEIAANKLLELDPENPGNYVLVSNAFAATEKWEEMEEVRLTMKGKGLKKDPACSWVETDNKCHVFIAHDKSHPESAEINQKLDRITEILAREGGYVAQTKQVLHYNLEEEDKVKSLMGHSERLAISYALLKTANGSPIRVTKNLRVCSDCHTFTKLVSKYFEREIIVRDANRFHHFREGVCSCGDFW